MTDHYHYHSVKNQVQEQSSSNNETFVFRVEPSSVPVFITKLCLMLDDNAMCELISWSNDGKRFCVSDIPGFSKAVLPQYFKHSNWPSFVRQLNMYGFHKVNDNVSARHGQMVCEFHHPLFYRNGRLALRKIRRNSRKSASTTRDSQTQHQQQQAHANRGEMQSSLSHQPHASTLSSSLPTSSMPISSLLSSNDHTSTADNDTFDTVTKDNDHNIDNMTFIDSKKWTMGGANNKNTICHKNRTIEIDNANHPYAGVSINNDLGDDHDGHYVKKHKDKHTAGDEDYGGPSQGNNYSGRNLIEPLAQQYADIRQQLDQLQSKTSILNSEMSFLKRYVTKQQESVIDLLNFLSVSIEPSDRSPLRSHQQQQMALKALQARSEQENSDASNGKRHNTLDDYHHYEYHHPHNNEEIDGRDGTYFDDNNQTKNGTKNTLHKRKQSTDSAEKDHHMHIHPLDNKESTSLEFLPLDNNNKHDTLHDGSLIKLQHNTGNSNGSSLTIGIKFINTRNRRNDITHH